MAEVRRLAADGRFDYLLIEGTGIAEPMPIAATFSFRDENGFSLSDIARLDTMVTVVDAAGLLKDFQSTDFLRDRGTIAGDDDERTLVDLLTDQIEFADVIVINKVSEAEAERLKMVRQIVRALNAGARIVETDFGRAPLGDIIGTGLFDDARAAEHALWAKELYGFRDHVPETEEYGVTSFVYRARRPLHPALFSKFLGEAWPGLLRAKGHFWLATRPEWCGELSIAGAACHTNPMGFWWAAVPKERWPDHSEWRADLKSRWSPVFGDRRQELVFIGIGLNEAKMRATLDACLLGEIAKPRFQPHRWAALPDPFPVWRRQAA